MRDQQMNLQLPASIIGATIVICLCLLGLGVSAVVHGFLPLSPALFAYAPLSSLSLYAALVFCVIKLESIPSPYSARPYSEQDSPTYFYIYLALLGFWSMILVPMTWVKLGALALKGASVDEQLAAHPLLTLTLSASAISLYFLRKWVIDQKDRLRADRLSPIPAQVSAIEALAPGWNTSDVWRTVPMTDEDLEMVSKRDKEYYRRWREDKLSTETQAVQNLRFTDALSSIIGPRPYRSSEPQIGKPFGIDSTDPNLSDFEEPTWLNSSSQRSQGHDLASSVHSIDEELNTRSIDDYDTRFDQSVISSALSHAKILADQKRWSGVSRPAQLPHRRQVTAGFTPLPISEPTKHHDQDNAASSPDSAVIDRSEAPTTPPQGVEAVSICDDPREQDLEKQYDSALRSREDQELFDEVNHIIALTEQHHMDTHGETKMDHLVYHPSSPSSVAASSLLSVNTEAYQDSALSKMSFSQLSELSFPQLETSVDLLNPTLVDGRFWESGELTDQLEDSAPKERQNENADQEYRRLDDKA